MLVKLAVIAYGVLRLPCFAPTFANATYSLLLQSDSRIAGREEVLGNITQVKAETSLGCPSFCEMVLQIEIAESTVINALCHAVLQVGNWIGSMIA